MIKKLEILMKQIEDCVDYVYECDDYYDGVDIEEDEYLKDRMEHYEYQKDQIEDFEDDYSIIWRVLIQLQKGQRTSKIDLEYVNEIHRTVLY